MKKLPGFSAFLLLLLSWPASLESEWNGYVKQSYQEWKQYFNPTEVEPWLSDTITSATSRMDKSGPVTEIESVCDFSFLAGTLSAGLFGRALWYANTAYTYLFIPLLNFQANQHHLAIGRFKPGTWGSGLLFSDYPVTGIHYTYQSRPWESRLFHLTLWERSDLQWATIRFSGFSESFSLGRGRIGILGMYDSSEKIEDASRGPLSRGLELSLQADWETESYWHSQAELAYSDRAWAFFAGQDIPISTAFALQARIRFLDQGFNPLFSLYSREGQKQTDFILRFPMNAFSEQLILTPEWGIKHTPDQNYWLPSIKMESELLDTFWIYFRLLAEQPISQWGAFEHYEYTEAALIWIMTGDLSLQLHWIKTFNGFLSWKETQSRAQVEWAW